MPQKKKNLTIHKRNEIVRGADDYSLFAKRAMNIIYYLIQKNNLYSYEKITVPFSNFRSLMNLDKEQNYVSIIKEAFLELKKTIELHNFNHPDGTHYKWYATSFLNGVGFTKKEDNRWYVTIEPNKTIKLIMQLQGNFTKLDLLIYQNKMRTKYGMKFYEFLKSFENYRYITLSSDFIRKLLKLENSKTYKHFADLKRLINRQINEIKEKTDLKELELEITKEKEFKFIINPKSKQQKPSKEEKEKKLNEFLQKSFTRF